MPKIIIPKNRADPRQILLESNMACEICHKPITNNQEIVICSNCKRMAHRDCLYRINSPNLCLCHKMADMLTTSVNEYISGIAKVDKP